MPMATLPTANLLAAPRQGASSDAGEDAGNLAQIVQVRRGVPRPKFSEQVGQPRNLLDPHEVSSCLKAANDQPVEDCGDNPANIVCLMRRKEVLLPQARLVCFGWQGAN